MPEKPEKRDSYQPGNPGSGYGGGQGLPSQASIDLLTKLLQEFERRSTPAATSVPPEVQKDIDAVTAAFESIERALSLGASPVVISAVTPDRGAVAGGTRVCITGSHLLPGSTVRFGNTDAKDVSFVSLTEIQATTPPGSAGYASAVDVVVTTFGGSASLARGYTYQG
jgi:hypothetical protein